MSYGYMVVSRTPIAEIQKHRRFKFLLIESSDDFFAYSRLEESNELTVRQGANSIFTPTGKEFFSGIPKPFFLVDYLLTKKQSEAEIVNLVKSKLKSGNFEKIRITSEAQLALNCLYEVSHD